MTTPLVHDPSRQASPSIRGYTYQIWCTVLEWITLDDYEYLYPECAEDFDKHTLDTAVTTQIKDHTSTITLGQAAARDAISNFLTTCTKNPDRKVRYNHLTRATPSREQNSPFGDGIFGIDVWNNLSKTEYTPVIDSQILIIISLIDKNETIRAFTAVHTLEDFHNKVIRKISWQTGAVDYQEVRQQVEEQLIVFGHQQGISPSDAQKIAGHLYQAAQDCAISGPPNYLNKARFLREFHEQTTVRLPTTPALNTGSLLLSNLSAIPLLPTFPLPPLPSRHLIRPNLISKLSQILSKSTLAWIYGGSGLGKSTLALQYVSQHKKEAQTSWFEARDSTPITIQLILQLLTEQSPQEKGIIVIDDLTAETYDAAQNAFAGAIFRAKKRMSNIIITSQAPPPTIHEKASVQLHLFAADETLAFSSLYGHGSSAASEVSSLIHNTAQGHPRLTRAYLESWDTVKSPTTLQATLSSVAEQARRMVNARHTDAGKQILVRANVTKHPITREALLHLAQELPAVPLPGAALEEVKSAWMDELGPDLYRVSPQLEGIFETWCANAQQARLRQAYLDYIASNKTITPWEWSNIISLGSSLADIPSNEQQVLRACHFFLSMSAEDKRRMGGYIGNAIEEWSHATAGNSLFAKVSIAAVQFCLVSLSSTIQPVFKNTILEQIDALLAQVNRSDLSDVAAGIFLLYVIMTYTNVRLGPIRVLQYTLMIVDLVRRIKADSSSEIMRQMSEALPHRDDNFLLFVEPFTAEDLQTLITSVDAHDPDEQEAFLNLFSRPEGELRLIIHFATLRSLENCTEQQRLKIGTTLRECHKIASRWPQQNWAESFARTLGVYLIEEFNDIEGASAVLESQVSMSQARPLILRDLEAQILSKRQDYNGVIDSLQPVLESGSAHGEFYDGAIADSWWRLGHAFANSSKWPESHSAFVNGAKYVSLHQEYDREIGFLIDAIYIAYRACDVTSALQILEKVVPSLLQTVGRTESIRKHWNTLIFGHVISRAILGKFEEVPFGCAGQPKLSSETVDLPPATPTTIYSCYIGIAHDHLKDHDLLSALGRAAECSIEVELDHATSHLLTFFSLSEFGYGRRRTPDNLKTLIAVVNSFTTKMRITPDTHQAIGMLLYATAINTILIDKSTTDARRWIEELTSASGAAGSVGRWAADAMVPLGPAARNPSWDDEQRVLFSLSRSVSGRAGVQGIYSATLMLIQWIAKVPNNEFMQKAFLEWSKSAWGSVGTMALQLKLPMYVLPIVREVMSASELTFQSLAHMLLEVEVGIRSLSPYVREALETIRTNGVHRTAPMHFFDKAWRHCPALPIQ